MRKKYVPHKPRKGTIYCERTGHGLYGRPLKYICKECNFSSKGYKSTCPNCHTEGQIICLGLTARPPRKNASKAKWRRFWDRFGRGSHPKGCR